MNVTFICDPMMNLEGSIRPASYLAEELANRRDFNVLMVSPFMSEKVESFLHAKGITPFNLRTRLLTKRLGSSVSWLEAWMWEAFLKMNSKHLENNSSIVINFSQVVSVPAVVWYLQGPPSLALRDMEKELLTHFRVLYSFLKPAIKFADERLIGRLRIISSIIIANSKYCASMYLKQGVDVDDVIYPPIDCQIFHPSTSNPSSDYALAYFGKETKFSVIKRVADLGVKIRAFGSKVLFVRRDVVSHPNIEFLGRVSMKELVDLYSNGAFTLFPFTHEPFGYVPLESMACGTPTLSYNMQGPSECIIDNYTGWLVQTDDELVEKALKLWKRGYPSHLREICVKEASRFDKKFYLEKWHKILDNFNGLDFLTIDRNF